jgi:HD-like signal output (HDOD) protein
LGEPSPTVARIRDAFADPGFKPPHLPAAALDLHRLAQRPDVSFEEAVAVLERDPQLASEVLRSARSAAFATRVPPSSLRQAVSRLGLSNLRDLAFMASFAAKVFRAPGYDRLLDAVRRHSVASAQAARILTKGQPDADYAFLCGLLHDLGMVAAILVLAEDAPLADAVVAETLSVVHEAAGAIVVEKWELPDGLVRAAAGHHTEHAAPSQEAALAFVGHAVAVQLGYALPLALEAEIDEAALARACAQLDLTPESFERGRAAAAEPIAALLG